MAILPPKANKVAQTPIRTIKIAPPGFEPGSTAPKAIILDHYTTGLYLAKN